MPARTPPRANKKLSQEEFKALQRLWYAKLKAKGFQDVEVHPDEVPEGQERMLKDWHSSQFCRPDMVAARRAQADYQERVDAFRNDPAFPEVCKLATNHPLCKLSASDAQLAWEMHCQGRSERDIAADIGSEATAVHRLIDRMRQWMKLL